MTSSALNVLALNCSLKNTHNKELSSTDALLSHFIKDLSKNGATAEVVRVADYNIQPGVTDDEGGDDEWPQLLEKVKATDVLVIGCPIWLGQPSSVAKRVLERMDAFLDQKDDRGRMPSCGKVGVCVVVGNEDGAHHTGAEVCQALFEVGFTIAAGGTTYWVGEAMGSKEYKEFKEAPKAISQWNEMLASNVVHLARLLKASQYPGVDGES